MLRLADLYLQNSCGGHGLPARMLKIVMLWDASESRYDDYDIMSVRFLLSEIRAAVSGFWSWLLLINIGALSIRIPSWGILYCKYNK